MAGNGSFFKKIIFKLVCFEGKMIIPFSEALANFQAALPFLNIF